MKNGVILFDGVCDLCNSTVRWVLKNDKKWMSDNIAANKD